MIGFFHDVLYVPLYNLLIFLVGVLPGGDVGVAIILVTLAVKIVVLPFSIGALKTQKAMKAIEPKLKELKEKYKDDKEKQAREMFALYKEHKIKPFSSLLTLVIQIPILITLYLVFLHEKLPVVDTALLYSFVSVPDPISTLFLGFFAVSGSSLVLALIAAATQFVQAYYAIPVPPKKEGVTPASMQEEFGRAMALQARFALPLVIGVVAYASGAVALYFVTSNLVAVAQEFLITRKIKKS